ncbi:MAG: type II secretion system F family protein [Phycisphaerae bacterium]|nr:type II secretion system F family protein [Phycisphaerae bacterium]
MPWFEYEGLSPGGTAVAGRIEAAGHDRAMESLAQMQVQVQQVRAAPRPARSPTQISEDDLIFFNEQLASLAKAGIALDEGLAQLARDVESPRLRRWITEVVTELRAGVPIDQAIARRQEGLPLLYGRVIQAGIQTGELPGVLLNLNQHLRLVSETRRLVWETASYPILVVLLALTITSGFFVFVVPRIKEVFRDFGVALPGLTLIMMWLSDHYLLIVLLGVLFFAGLAFLFHSLKFFEGGVILREQIVMSLPLFGRIKRASLVARFLRTVSTSLASGLPLPQAMRLAAESTGHRALITDADRLAHEVEKGQSIFVASQSARLIPPLFGYCVQVATGRETLPLAVGQLARSFENRAVHVQGLLRAFLLPAMIIVLGCFLALGVAAMFLPLVSLVNSVSG